MYLPSQKREWTKNKGRLLWILPIHRVTSFSLSPSTFNSLKEWHLRIFLSFQTHYSLASAWIQLWNSSCQDHQQQQSGTISVPIWLDISKAPSSTDDLRSFTPLAWDSTFTLYLRLLFMHPPTKQWGAPDFHHEAPSLHTHSFLVKLKILKFVCAIQTLNSAPELQISTFHSLGR